MAESAFGDSLFDEFEREPQSSDKILRQKFKEDKLKIQGLPTSSDLDSENTLKPGQCDSDSLVSGSETETEYNDEQIHAQMTETEKHVSGMLAVLRQAVDNNEPDVSGLSEKCRASDERYLRIEDVKTLQEEKMRLEKLSRLLSEKVKDEEGPAIQIVYMNHKVSRKYRSEIEEFIAGLISKERKIGRQLPILQTRPNAANIAVNQPVASLPEEKMRQTRACTAVGCNQLYNEFMLDYMGWPLVDYNTSLTDGWQLPYYEQAYRNILPCESDGEEEDEGLKKPSRSKTSCFNCGGEHNLSECKLPKDFKQIRKAKAEFRNQNSTPQFSRYTMDSLSSKYEHLRPGSISKRLKDAIGISSQQLPPYIYQMRLYGYPPGWLKEAEVESSGISLFDKHGKEVSHEADGEEGEVEQPQKKMLNPNKLVAYPGFNVPVDKGTIDECEKLGMPPMQPNQQLDVLRAYLSRNYELLSSGSKRKHSADGESDTSPKKQRQGSSADSDMDISADQGASPLLVRASNGSSSGSRPDTPSLSDLEAQQRALQRQLAEEMAASGDSNSPPLPPTPDRPPLPVDTPPVTPRTPDPPPMPPTPERPPLPVGTPPITPQTPKDGVFRTPHGITPLSSSLTLNEDGPVLSAASPVASTRSSCDSIDESGVDAATDDVTTPSSIPLNRTSSLSKSFGTPILEGGTPSSEGKKLPSADKFADGITEHLPFENLPNSTGRYAEVKKLIDLAKNPRHKSS